MEQNIKKESIFERIRKNANHRETAFLNIRNPWPGLSSYEEPVEGHEKWKFCGRENESFELTRMIDDNIFVTLYGKSGNGKTSLLNAGVFPKLRKMRYVPIPIRLGMNAIGMSFQRCIIRNIEKTFTHERIEERLVVPRVSDEKSVNYLWNYFARHRFFANNLHETIVYPVIVFDQFEEVYRQRREDADLLLQQINYLADGSHELEDCIVEDELYTYEYNFRFLISIREDDLCYLEDSIDNNMLYPMKQTRYRLRSLSEQNAKDVIFVPGDGLFEEEEKVQIANTIIRIAKGKNQDISSNILSLICSRIYIDHIQKGENDKISYELVNGFISEKPLEKFYIEAVSHLTRKKRAYLEDELVDAMGRRDYIPKTNFERVFEKEERNALLNGPFKILQENNDRIELIHDSFCQVLLDQKAMRMERWRTIVENVAQMLMCLLLCYKHSLYFSFCTSLQPVTFFENVCAFLIRTFPYLSAIFLFIVAGVIRKSFPTWFTLMAAIVLILPPLAELAMGSISVYLPVSHQILSLFLLGVIIVANVYNRKNRADEKESRLSFGDFIDIRSLRLWWLVYLCYLVHSYIYTTTDGWYVDKAVYSVYLAVIPALFYSVFEKEWWAAIFLLIMPISFLVYFTSDILFFSFPYGWQVTIFYAILCFGVPLQLLWKINEEEMGLVKRLIPILIFLAITFTVYGLFYKYKLIMLAVWCLIAFILLFYIARDENKHEAVLCIVTFILTLGLYTYTKGYNPLIKNVDVSKQKGEWHWNAVIAYSGQDYRLYDGLTGRDMLGIGFDFQDEDLNLVKKMDDNVHVRYEINNALYAISGAERTLTYKSHPLFEQCIGRDFDKNYSAAVIIKQHRKLIFNDVINTSVQRPKDQTKSILERLLAQELAVLDSTIALQNDSIVKCNISELLCKTLSSNWLYYAVDSIGTIGGDWYFNYLCAFNHFAKSHYFEQMYQKKNADWDGSFEELSVKFLECTDNIHMPSCNQTLKYVVPRLINKYNNTYDYGLKTLLYGKIIRMQQLAILQGCGNEKWARTMIESPVGVDINQFYQEHRTK